MISFGIHSGYIFGRQAISLRKGFLNCCDKGLAILQVLAMNLRYAYTLGDLTLRRWCWFPLPIHSKHVTIGSRNIANINVLVECSASILNPIPKENFVHVGRDEGLRITHNLKWRPVNLCLGMSLTFLSEFFQTHDPLAAARVLNAGGTKESIEIQAIYNSLLGYKGSVDREEYYLLRGVLEGKLYSKQKTHLSSIIETFLKDEKSGKSLRQFVLDRLEEAGEEVNPDLYALILELDADWIQKQNFEERRYQSTHFAIIQTLAKWIHAECRKVEYLSGKIQIVADKIQNLPIGSYIIHLPNHAAALVKTEKEFALFEPRSGLAFLLSKDKQKDALEHLLQHYALYDGISIKISFVENRTYTIYDK